MNSRTKLEDPGLARFRAKLLLAMMVLVAGVTGLGLFFAQRNAAADVKRDFQGRFQAELDSLHAVEELRHAMLAERCRSLARRPRIHAALEDNALDLLYPSALDELADVMEGGEGQAGESAAPALHAAFYRFLDAKGKVIEPSSAAAVGSLRPQEESQLALKAAPEKPQVGFIWRGADSSGATIDEVIAMPIVSAETEQVIAAIVLGFKSSGLKSQGLSGGIKSGLSLNGRLLMPELGKPAEAELEGELGRAISGQPEGKNSFEVRIEGQPHLLFYKWLNPDSQFPPAYEIRVYPLSGLIAKQRLLVWQFAGAGGLLLVGAFAASQFLSGRLSRPVERLAVDFEKTRADRERAQAELESTGNELRRSARFSADASHQLKTPVTVLRAGLEELLASETLTPGAREEIAALVHQTFRLTSVIEDLLLLSRMDGGRLQIRFGEVNLTQLVEAWLDDFSALTDPLELDVETDLPPALTIAGEKRYATLIIQNLLENARKYNRPGGRIRISGRNDGYQAVLSIGNTGRPIPPAAQAHIFERFHRGSAGENIPGHGLGLNLARELARLHGGDLRLARSDEDWTEFEVRFRLAGQSPAGKTE